MIKRGCVAGLAVTISLKAALAKGFVVDESLCINFLASTASTGICGYQGKLLSRNAIIYFQNSLAEHCAITNSSPVLSMICIPIPKTD